MKGDIVLENFRKISIYEVIAFLAVMVMVAGYLTGVVNINSVVLLVLSSFLSTFLGATYAFRLNSKKDKEKEDERRQSALQLALFILARQDNAIRTVWKQIKDWDGRKDAFFNMPPIVTPLYEDLKQNFSEISFLLETDSPNVLFKLSIEQERFSQTIIAINERAKFHFEDFQPKVADTGIGGKDVTLDEVKNILGERIFGVMEATTKNLFSHLSLSLKSLSSTADELFKLAKKEYPNCKFLYVVDVENK